MPAVLSQVAARRDDGPGHESQLVSAADGPISLPKIRVEIADTNRFLNVEPAWLDLAARAAEPNVFMDPVIVAAAANGMDAENFPVLLAWRDARLVGVWALRRAYPRSGFPWPILVSPAHETWPDSTPVVDQADATSVLGEMLQALSSAPELPKIIGVELMNDGGVVMAALRDALAARNSSPVFLGNATRPRLTCGEAPDAYIERAVSGGRRRKLGQLRRRLARRGKLELVVHRTEDAVRAGLERFLRLEAAGWKGNFGRPLLHIPDFRDFTRQTIPALATRQRAEIWELALDDAPVSMAIILRSGSRAYDWRIAYDENHADCSPGVLLALDYTSAFLSDPTLTVGDSCAQNDSGVLGGLWLDRQPMVNLMFDVTGGHPPAFVLLGAVERLYRRARALAKGPFHATKARLRQAMRHLRSNNSSDSISATTRPI